MTTNPEPIPSADHGAKPPTPSTVSLMWETRPVRSTQDRKLAGVCSGIARRYEVDPLLVRLAFVAAVFLGGSGITIYAGCWLVMRRVGKPSSMVDAMLRKGPWSESKALAVILAIICGSGIISTVGSLQQLWGSGLLGWIGLSAGLYGLYKHQPAPTTQWVQWSNSDERFRPPFRPNPMVPEGYEHTPYPTPGHSLTEPAGLPLSPPSWDPLSTAQFAWDLPDPAVTEEKRPPKSRFTFIVLGITIIVGALTAGIEFAVRNGTDDSVGITALSLSVLVLGLGMLVGSFSRRGYGLLPIAGPLVGIMLIAALAHSGPVSMQVDFSSQAGDVEVIRATR